MRFVARVVAGSLVVALSLLLLAAASAAPKATTTINVTITDKAIKLSKKTATVGDGHLRRQEHRQGAPQLPHRRQEDARR